MNLTIIIPAYNEELRVVSTIDSVRQFLDDRSWTYEIIVVDDGSKDETAQRVEQACTTRQHLRLVCAESNQGKGAAVRLGVEHAHGDIVGFIDADDKTDISGLDEVFRHLEDGAQIVIGDRTLADTAIHVQRRAYRELGSRLFRRLLRWWLGLGDYPDTQCGFKFYRTNVLRGLYQRARIDGYMFDVELLVLAHQARYRIDRIGVTWRDDPDSRFQPLSGSWHNIRELLRIRRLHVDELPDHDPSSFDSRPPTN